jgi:hypothetical protein
MTHTWRCEGGGTLAACFYSPSNSFLLIIISNLTTVSVRVLRWKDVYVWYDRQLNYLLPTNYCTYIGWLLLGREGNVRNNEYDIMEIL